MKGGERGRGWGEAEDDTFSDEIDNVRLGYVIVLVEST